MYATPMQHVYDVKFLQNVFFIVVLDECHKHRSVVVVWDEHALLSTLMPMHMSYACRSDTRRILPDQAMKVNMIAILSTITAGYDSTITKMMETLLS